MAFDRYLNEFSDYLATVGMSDRTIGTYSSYAERFALFLKTYYPRIRSFEKITKEIILDYQNYL